MLHILGGAIAGAIIGAAAAALVAAVTGRPVTWKGVLAGAVGGAVAGAVTTATLGVGGVAAASTARAASAFVLGGASGGALTQASDNVLHDRPVGDNVVTAGTVGGVLGGATFGAGKALAPVARRVLGSGGARAPPSGGSGTSTAAGDAVEAGGRSFDRILGEIRGAGGAVADDVRPPASTGPPPRASTATTGSPTSGGSGAPARSSRGFTDLIDDVDDGLGVGAGGAANAGRTELLAELTERGIRHSADDIVDIRRLADGRIAFLETGNARAGLQHIVERHAGDFARVGIPESRIPAFVMDALSRGRVVGHQGRGTGRPIFELLFDGQTRRVAVTMGDNGFVVGANPASMP